MPIKRALKGWAFLVALYRDGLKRKEDNRYLFEGQKRKHSKAQSCLATATARRTSVIDNFLQCCGDNFPSISTMPKPIPQPAAPFSNPHEDEERTVHTVYEAIAPHFSQTRFKVGSTPSATGARQTNVPTFPSSHGRSSPSSSPRNHPDPSASIAEQGTANTCPWRTKRDAR